MKTCYKISVIIVFFIIIFSNEGMSKQKDAFVLVSSRYQPYIENLEGYLKKSDFINDVNYYEDNLNTIEAKLADNEYDVGIAIGLQAYEFIKKRENDLPLFYSLLVYPQYENCGIYLQPEPKNIIDLIISHHPTENLFIPVSEKTDSSYFNRLNAYAGKKNIKVNYYFFEEFKTSIKQKQKLPIKDTLLFVPDKVFFSEIVIKDFFEKLELNNLFVVGYNPFFCRLGADLCFKHDFVKMGEQLSNIINNYFKNGKCKSESGYFKVIGDEIEK